ncbi:YozE SAM-like domain-containing protein [Pontibacter korlensis]|uniref:Uncharacterized protein n=1 Tax=Pontibacter korlensis TaxID=400092 RepID=A0A0E3UYA8_9BACT|nr:hypothetical protein PKOR_20150 [Pontibacter korlensis]
MNRKYIVDTATRVYLCVALQKGKDWAPTNQDSLQSFMNSCKGTGISDAGLLSGEFNDNSFFEKWIRNGTNYLFRY